MNNPHWLYFIALENDLIGSIPYVEIDKPNYTTFSINFGKLLLSICSEIDVIAKILCKKINNNSCAKKIDHYRSELLSAYPNMPNIEIEIPRYNLKIKPWEEWNNDDNPSWWKSYNNVKHQRDSCYSEANQKNVIDSLSGLFSLLLYLYKGEINCSNLEPEPQLFHYPTMYPSSIVIEHNLRLP